MKEIFRDVIRTAMEVALDEKLGWERCQLSQKPESMSGNCRNGYSKKIVKSQLVEIDS